jgi:hypothetical protein
VECRIINYAVLHIGYRSLNLYKRAIVTANKIGKVEVDFGEANCIIPDARERLAVKNLKFKLI